MTTISAKIIADSISPAGKRLRTLQTRHPLVIHAELLTHRQFSRNARSSRAVPIATMIREVEEDPFVPLHWGAAQKGMQAYAELTGSALNEAKASWQEARDDAVHHAWSLCQNGAHKQIVNRLLAPFLHIDTLVSATEWDGFFAQRLHPAAEPHMLMLAEAMRDAMAASGPKLLQPGEWHLPYVTDAERETHSTDVLRKISTRRCSRISYEPFDGNGSLEVELRRYDQLVAADPVHGSPLEHQATPDTEYGYYGGPRNWNYPEDHRNLTGWRQNRALVEREAST